MRLYFSHADTAEENEEYFVPFTSATSAALMLEQTSSKDIRKKIFLARFING